MIDLEPALVTTWQEAEEVAARWMRANGFPDAHRTAGGADEGVDVRATGAIAQVKFEGAATGRPAIQRLVGAAGRSSSKNLLFFSAAGYSEKAKAYAAQENVWLFLLAPFGQVLPASEESSKVAGRHQPASKNLAELAEAGDPNAQTELVNLLVSRGDLVALAAYADQGWQVARRHLAKALLMVGDLDALKNRADSKDLAAAFALAQHLAAKSPRQLQTRAWKDDVAAQFYFAASLDSEYAPETPKWLSNRSFVAERARRGDLGALYYLSEKLADEGNMFELRHWADKGDALAQAALAEMLVRKGDTQELQRRAADGDAFSSERLDSDETTLDPNLALLREMRSLLKSADAALVFNSAKASR